MVALTSVCLLEPCEICHVASGDVVDLRSLQSSQVLTPSVSILPHRVGTRVLSPTLETL